MYQNPFGLIRLRPIIMTRFFLFRSYITFENNSIVKMNIRKEQESNDMIDDYNENKKRKIQNES
jgi:hypothetical protein